MDTSGSLREAPDLCPTPTDAGGITSTPAPRVVTVPHQNLTLFEQERNMSETREAETSTEQEHGVAFERFWSSYPRKVGKGAARKAFDKALSRADLSQIMEGLHRYNKDPERVRKGQEFTVHPVTWLNQDRWLDDLAVAPSVRVVDLTKRFENAPEGITFDVWLRQHASLEEIEKARQFGVGRTLKNAESA